MSKKRRLSFRVDEDEAVVIGPRERWEHLVVTYEALATWYPEEEQTYLELAAWIRGWLDRTRRTDVSEKV